MPVVAASPGLTHTGVAQCASGIGVLCVEPAELRDHTVQYRDQRFSPGLGLAQAAGASEKLAARMNSRFIETTCGVNHEFEGATKS